MLYNFRNKDPIIDIMRTIAQTRADIDGVKFGSVLMALEKETKRELRYATMAGWFYGATMYPRYCGVARFMIAMEAYIRKPVVIGDRKVQVRLRIVA